MRKHWTKEEANRARETSALVRIRRKELKHALREGRMTLRQAFDEPFLHPMPVEKLLLACKGIGPVKTSETLARAQCSPRRPVKLVTERQQAVILEFVA